MEKFLNNEHIKNLLIEIGYFILEKWGHNLEYGTFSSVEVDKILFEQSRKRIRSSEYITQPIQLGKLLSQSDLILTNCISITTEEEQVTFPLNSFFYFFNILEKISGVKPKDRMKWVKKPQGELISAGDILFSPKHIVKEQAPLLFLKDKQLNCEIDFQNGIMKLESICGYSFKSKVTISSKNISLTSFSCHLSKDKLKNMNGRCLFSAYKIKQKKQDIVVVLIENDEGNIISLKASDNFRSFPVRTINHTDNIELSKDVQIPVASKRDFCTNFFCETIKSDRTRNCVEVSENVINSS